MGFKFIQSRCEADSTLATLFHLGVISGVIGNDMDMLPLGVDIVILNFMSFQYWMNGEIVAYRLSAVLFKLGLSYEQFVDACILSGCDYTSHQIYKNDFMRSVALMKYYLSIENYFSDLNIDNEEYINARKMFIGLVPLDRMQSVSGTTVEMMCRLFDKTDAYAVNLIKYGTSRLVSIYGINKISLLHEMWLIAPRLTNAQLLATLKTPSRANQTFITSFSYYFAPIAVVKYISGFCGRRLEIDISGDRVDPTKFESYTKVGAFTEILKKLNGHRLSADSLPWYSQSKGRRILANR
jgi:hypothetical protein